MKDRNAVLAFFRLGGLAFLAFGALVFLLGSGGGSSGATISGSVFGFIGLCWYLTAKGVGSWYGKAAQKQAADRDLFKTGTRATAVIEKVEPSATTINNMPVVYVTVQVTPKYGSPFSHTEKIVTPVTAVPLPGHLVDVAYDPADPSRVVLEANPGFQGLPGVVLKTRPGDEAAVEADTGDEQLDRLERLAKLHNAGVLTDAEFAEEKSRLLHGS